MKAKQRLIDEAYQSWEPLLYEKLVQYDYFLQSIQNDLSAAGLSYKDSEQFLNIKASEILSKIKSERIGLRRSKGTQRRKVG